MPTNHTPNYNLNQWERTDKILMDDFNADNAKIDETLGEHAAQLSRLGNCRMEMFSYTGDGTFGAGHPVTITFSAMPKVFFIVGANGAIFCRGGDTHGTAIIHTSRWGATGASLYTTLQWSGNTVRYYAELPETQLNKEGTSTWIIAFYAEDEK